MISDETVNPVQAWQMFTSINLHLSGKYDCVKYKFQMPSLRAASFSSRKDRYHYEKAVRKYPDKKDLIWYFVSNIIDGNNWIGELQDESFTNFQSKLQSFTYRFKSDVNKLKNAVSNFDELLGSKSSKEVTAPIITLLDNDAVMFESVAIIEHFTKFCSNQKHVYDPLGILSEKLIQIEKYGPLLATYSGIDFQICRQYLIDSFKSQ